jgi:lysine-specific demethylase/histidyl-hydroxylase NO66
LQGAVSSAEWQDGRMLDWMLRPCTTHQFIKQHLDQRPLHISRQKHQHYFDGLLTKADIQQLLKSQQLQYGTNVDVTSYTNGQRTNLNYNGSESTDQLETANASTVMRRFNMESCSVRILHPQRWVEPVYKLLSMLEDELRSPVGCNAYLTPPSSQGFAPHWDDIDAFVLQVEVRIMLFQSPALSFLLSPDLT